MRVALFGGSFDPPHNGHLIIARAVLKFDPTIDEVWLLPTYQHHWKPMHASAQDRLAMTKLLEEEKIKASNVDVVRKITQNIETIRYLQSSSKNEYLWVAGADIVKDFPLWGEYKELQQRIPFLIIPRKGVDVASLPENFTMMGKRYFTPVDFSSTEIRRRLHEGLSIDTLIPKKVANYIYEKKMYK